MPLPERFTLTDQFTHLEITYRWRTPLDVVMAVFAAVFMLGLVRGWVRIATGDLYRMDIEIVGLTLGIAALGYLFLARQCNRTIIHASRREIEIRHRPVPWPEDTAVAVPYIDHVDIEEKPWVGNRYLGTRYDVCAIMRDGTRLPLVVELQAKQEALFIRQELTACLQTIAAAAAKGRADESAPATAADARAGPWADSD